MRTFWLVFLTSCLAIIVTFLVVADRPRTCATAQEIPQADEKKTEAKQAAEKKPISKFDPLDEEILQRTHLTTDGKALIEFLKHRTLPEKERPAVERMVRQLGSSDYRTREKATSDLVERGVAVLEVLRHALTISLDGEATRRIARSIQNIHEKDVPSEVPAAVVRVLAAQEPAELIETLIGYLPVTDNDRVLEEIRLALTKHAVTVGKTEPALRAALSDRAALRRATAAEVLVRVAYAEHKDELRKMLADADPLVRYRLARALVFAQQRDALPILIDTIPDLPLNTAWQAEDFLLKLTTGASAPSAPMGNGKDARAKCKAGWHAWWKKHGAKLDLANLANLEDTPKLLGRTLIILLDQHSVLELGRDNRPRWEVKGLSLPLDVQLVGEDRVLVAEYQANRVTERNLRGDVLWQKVGIQGPQVAQRLANGNTFVATAYSLLEYDKDDHAVLNVNLSTDGQQKVMKALKLDNGEIVCMHADGRIVRYDSRGTELHSFPINIGARLFGGRVHMLPTGRIVVPHHSEGKVVEYDRRGKIVWEIPFDQPIAAARLPNGNTLITSMNSAVGAVEVDRAGAVIWSYTASNSRVTRAIRR